MHYDRRAVPRNPEHVVDIQGQGRGVPATPACNPSIIEPPRLCGVHIHKSLVPLGSTDKGRAVGADACPPKDDEQRLLRKGRRVGCPIEPRTIVGDPTVRKCGDTGPFADPVPSIPRFVDPCADRRSDGRAVPGSSGICAVQPQGAPRDRLRVKARTVLGPRPFHCFTRVQMYWRHSTTPQWSEHCPRECRHSRQDSHCSSASE